jgi:hypothetical protein
MRDRTKSPALAIDLSIGAGTPSRAFFTPSTPISRVETGHFAANLMFAAPENCFYD